MTQTSDDGAPPSAATDAVLVKSDEMPEDAQKVEELDFNKIKGPVTAEHLLVGMKNMGFQASAMAEAVRIINDMVLLSPFPSSNEKSHLAS
jgi:deoxyhypusine synthase